MTRLDFSAWGAARSEVLELYALSRDAQRLVELHQRLAACAPVWASRIAGDPATAGDPARLADAWQWRVLDTWVQEGLEGKSPAQLQSELEELANRRRRVIGDLVAQCAWRRLADNLGDRERQALNSYLKAVTRFGKTGGKFAARWLAEMRTALDESKAAVPVWIMTKDRALNSFRPEREAPFDVLVIDEASQIGLEAVPLFSLAHTAIVVGDDQQTSPENVGLNRQAVFDLLDEHLRDVPKYRTLFDPENSLYDVARQKYPDIVVLTEHFRSLPEIIEFSNKNFYDHRIVALRDRRPRPDWTALGTVAVPDGYRRGDVNEPEAQAVVDLIARLCADPDYDDMDFGVISLLGTGQAKRIWDLLFDRLGQAELDRRRLRCGEAANFQGDERDVMVLSLVAATDPENPLGRIGALASSGAHRRINVAASRARNQMWVVHSLDPERFPRGDLRADLIRHCANPPSLVADQAADLMARCDSPFERDVIKAIVAHGYRRVLVQHKVGRYRIDIVVEGPASRLAVECDGDRWHGPDQWHNDRARQEVLERAGWTFERIRGSAFYRDRAAALEPLWRRLEELGIPTEGASSTKSEQVRPDPVAATNSVETRQVEDLETREGDRHAWHDQNDIVEDVLADDGTDDLAIPPAIPAVRPPDAVASRALPAVHPSETSAPTSGADASILAPFDAWGMKVVPPVGTVKPAELIDWLVQIVLAEGPVLGRRLFQAYVRASGGHRVGKDIYRALSDATRLAVRAGRLSWLDDDATDAADKTFYTPG
ncbi:MAG: AAA domain-containing protein, partial [Gaiellaceae bacterium]